jgi:hypothetical protein
MPKLFLFAFLLISLSAKSEICTKTPADFDDNRIYMKIKNGKESFRFYTDSGGGLYPFVYNDVAAKLGMKIEKTVVDGDFKLGRSSFPESLSQQIPVAPEWQGNVKVFTFDINGKDEASESRFFLGDGFFGASFFKDKIWNFDYPKKELSYCDAVPILKNYSSLKMTFKKEGTLRITHQPRIEIEVSGSRISVLFDTGATSLYSKEAADNLKLAKPFTASSFIRASVAAKWIKQNPKWKFIKGGEKFAGGGDLVEVPLVKVAGIEVGPVWFATRNDKIYDKYSKDVMDSNIDGAVGGNLFRYFEIIADYPKEAIYFKKASE